MQKIKLYSAIGCLVLVAQVSANERLSAIDKLRNVQKESAIPVWQTATQQITNYHDDMRNAFILGKWKLLDDWIATNPQQAPITIITNPRDELELGAYVDWLRWRILAKNADGRYSYAYAYLLSQLPDAQSKLAEEILIFYLHAQLSLQIDELRCANEKNRGFFSTEFEAQDKIKAIKEMLNTLSTAQISTLRLNAQTIEVVRGQRGELLPLCPKTLKGKQFISKELWQKRRALVMDKILEDTASVFP